MSNSLFPMKKQYTVFSFTHKAVPFGVKSKKKKKDLNQEPNNYVTESGAICKPLYCQKIVKKSRVFGLAKLFIV